MRRQTVPQCFLPVCAVVSIIVAGALDGAEVDQPRFERPAHYLVEDRPIAIELGPTPLPMLDWGYVLAGHVDYVEKATGKRLPLNDPHDVRDADDVVATPLCVPSGVRLRVQPARKGGTFAQELFAPQFPWEENCSVHCLSFDESSRRFKLWYRTKGHFAFAESADFNSWAKPFARVTPHEGSAETNLLGIINVAEVEKSDLRSVKEARLGYAGGFFVDPDGEASARHKGVFLGHLKSNTGVYAEQSKRPISGMTGPGSTVLFGATSEDGVAWRVLPQPIMLHDGDTQSVPAYDRLAKTFLLYTRRYQLNRRTVAFAETKDFQHWPLPQTMLSPGPMEHPSVDYYASAFAPYPGDVAIKTMLCTVYDRSIDRSEIRLAIGRDGRNFHFSPGGPILSTGPAEKDESGFLSAFPSLVRTPDGRMVFFYDAHRTPHKFPRHRFGGSKHFAAWWPADRLMAIEAPERGEFTLAPVKLAGTRLSLNMLSERTGQIRVEVRDEAFKVVPGRSFADCDPVIGDHPAATVSWKGNADLASHRGKTVYLSFQMRAAKLFALAAN